mmetsp:Transcript_52525/g.122167  ORF Transcript_52525/g.122167 Transcript_52525/m.122167 type:complete len:208 (+) Transcript_52525:918-1541(+)
MSFLLCQLCRGLDNKYLVVIIHCPMRTFHIMCSSKHSMCSTVEGSVRWNSNFSSHSGFSAPIMVWVMACWSRSVTCTLGLQVPGVRRGKRSFARRTHTSRQFGRGSWCSMRKQLLKASPSARMRMKALMLNSASYISKFTETPSNSKRSMQTVPTFSTGLIPFRVFRTHAVGKGDHHVLGSFCSKSRRNPSCTESSREMPEASRKYL